MIKKRIHTMKITSRFFRIIAVLCLTASIISPVFSAEDNFSTSGEFTLYIHCGFTQDKDNTYSNHLENQFLLTDATASCYAIADVSSDGRAYYISGWTEDREIATVFTPTLNSSEPGELVIRGTSAATYSLMQIQTLNGYQLVPDPISIKIEKTENQVSYALIDSQKVEAPDGIVEFTIANTVAFDLPRHDYQQCKYGKMYKPTILILGLIILIASLLLLALIIYSPRNKEDDNEC